MGGMEKTCSQCGQPVYARGLCSRHYQHARYHGELPGQPARTCAECGQVMQDKTARARFCSMQCKEKARQRGRRGAALEEVGERRCLNCGALIPASVTLKAKVCSRDCGVKWQNRQKAARKHEAAMAARDERPPCPRCGSPVPSGLKNGTIYCSKNCQQLAWNERTGYMRQYLYGVSLEQYEAMMAAQGGVCAICGTSDWPGKDNRPHVDHCHETGKVRGILCGPCNNGLGNFGDDPARLRAAAAYLEAAMT